MNMTQIIEALKMFGRSNSFYYKLYDRITELQKNDPKTFEEYRELLESQHFKDEIDVMLHFDKMPTFTVKGL